MMFTTYTNTHSQKHTHAYKYKYTTSNEHKINIEKSRKDGFDAWQVNVCVSVYVCDASAVAGMGFRPGV